MNHRFQTHRPKPTLRLRRFPSTRWLHAAQRAGIRTRFVCPACGGSSFGSSGMPPAELQRMCHGNDAGDGRHGCKFRWLERDDHKYFYVGTTR